MQTTDVLIIGAGAAGIRAAVESCKTGAETILVAKGPLAASGSTFSPLSPHLGLQALVGVERTPEALDAFFDDIMRVGLGCCDPELVHILVEESGDRFEDLLSYGILFKRDETGRHLLAAGCFSQTPRAFITASKANLKKSLASIFRHPPANMVRFMEGEALSLIVSDGICGGARVWTAKNELVQIHAKATVLATGGGAGLFRHHMVSDLECGQGYALAYEAGAEMANLEFIQFMLGYLKDARPCFLPIDALDQPGRLVDQNGADLLCKHIPDPVKRRKAVAARKAHFPFSSRDHSALVDLAVTAAKAQGGPVFWKESDFIEDSYEVVHFSHAFNGGVRIDARGRTSVEGLFAAGEVAAGPHGADRIGGCMMTATQVFGARAGRFAALKALKTKTGMKAQKEWPFTNGHAGGSAEADAKQILAGVRDIFSLKLGLWRNRTGLSRCLEAIKAAEADLAQLKKLRAPVMQQVRQALLAMRLVTQAALNRNESRGAHYRSDNPPLWHTSDPRPP